MAFLVHAAHQEDVVVDAERDQEDEAEERHGRVRAREAEDPVEDERRDPEGRAEGEHGRQHQQDRGDHGAQQQHEDHEDHREHDGDDQVAVVDGGVVRVDGGRGHPADERLDAGDYGTASEFVGDLIRADMRRRGREKLERLLLDGLVSGEAEEVTEETLRQMEREAEAIIGAARSPGS